MSPAGAQSGKQKPPRLRTPKTEPATAQTLTDPIRLAATASGELLVTDYRAGQVFVLDPTTRAVVGSLAITSEPLGIATAGDLVYVGNQTTRRVETYRMERRTRRGATSFGFRKLGELGVEVRQPTDIAVDGRRCS